MITGTVKYFHDSKGYGFITSNGKDYFVHYKEIKAEGFKTLKNGTSVKFNPSTSPKGLIATDVQVVK